MPQHSSTPAIAQSSAATLQSTLDAHASRMALLDGDGIIILVNAAWEHAITHRVAPGFFSTGTNYLQRCDQANPDSWWEAPRLAAGIRQLLRHERDAFVLEYTYPSAGQTFCFKVKAKRLLSGDGPPTVIIVHEDITEHRRMQEKSARSALKLAEVNTLLAERNTELVEFTHALHHDLQEPLRQVVTFSQLLQHRLGTPLEQEAEESLHFIINGAQRMLALVQYLSDFIQLGQVEMKREWFALSTCLREVLKALDVHLEESGAEVIDEGLPKVLGDPSMLTQLYLNLIGNAIKFAGQTRPVIHLTAERQAEGWLFGVRDNGIGIDPSHAKRLFEPFKRLHSRAQYDGSGLGLAACRRIVRRHGGDIWAELEVDQGAYFKFTLPDVQP